MVPPLGSLRGEGNQPCGGSRPRFKPCGPFSKFPWTRAQGVNWCYPSWTAPVSWGYHIMLATGVLTIPGLDSSHIIPGGPTRKKALPGAQVPLRECGGRAAMWWEGIDHSVASLLWNYSLWLVGQWSYMYLVAWSWLVFVSWNYFDNTSLWVLYEIPCLFVL